MLAWFDNTIPMANYYDAFDCLCISPSDTQRVIKKALEESGLMSSIKIDSACTDETTDYKSKQMSRLGRGRGETPFRQLSNAL